MASRPRRSAATKANEVISVHAKWANTSEKSERSERSAMSSRRSGRNSGGATLRDAPSSQDDLSVEVASSKPRQSGRGAGRRDPFEGGEIVHGKRNRGAKKSYVVDSSPDDEEEEEEEEAEIDDDGVDEDAEGEDDMELDAEGEDVDADGDVSMNMTPNIIRPTIKVSRPAALPRARPVVEDDDEDDDDEELSDPGESEPGDETMAFGDDTVADADEDAEGEEIEVAGDEEDEDEDEEDEEAEGAEGAGEDDSDEEGSQGEAPDLNKMTKRQRARFEDEPQQYMKLSDGKSSRDGLPISCTAHITLQRSKSRSTSQQRSCPCGARKWREDAATSARSATRKSRSGDAILRRHRLAPLRLPAKGRG